MHKQTVHPEHANMDKWSDTNDEMFQYCTTVYLWNASEKKNQEQKLTGI